MKLAIMQPTYLPWLGYLSLIAQVDRFVFLDDVPMAQQRPNWQKENRILANGQIRWMRLPTVRPGGPVSLLKDVVLKSADWPEDHIRLLQEAYADESGYAVHGRALEAVLRAGHERLVDLNIEAIRCLMTAFGIDTPLLRSSEIERQSAAKGENLINICRALGATEYISPPGAAGYCRAETFSTQGIGLEFYDYRPRSYPQGSSNFVSHLSAVDVLMRAPGQAREQLSPE